MTIKDFFKKYPKSEKNHSQQTIIFNIDRQFIPKMNKGFVLVSLNKDGVRYSESAEFYYHKDLIDKIDSDMESLIPKMKLNVLQKMFECSNEQGN